MSVILYGYQYSVYQRIARLVLLEKAVPFDFVDINPFSEDLSDDYLKLHPFRRVPALLHEGFALYETEAIIRYIDEAFSGPPLQPVEPKQRARMSQIISIINSYGYFPMIRQVFSQRVFRPRYKMKGEEVEISEGLAASKPVLDVLETIAGEGLQLSGKEFTLADLYLAPMMSYFVAAPEGLSLLNQYPTLSDWWFKVQSRDSMRNSDPGLPSADITAG